IFFCAPSPDPRSPPPGLVTRRGRGRGRGQVKPAADGTAARCAMGLRFGAASHRTVGGRRRVGSIVGLMAIAQAEFGRTGHHSTRVIFGGASHAAVPQRVADETLDVLLSYGVNHLDMASSYGEAEVRIRPWLRREPGRFFLATKGDERTKEGAREELHRSLDRMGVDRVDLWQ